MPIDEFGNSETTREWPGVLDPSLLRDDLVSAGHRLADAAKAADWSTVLRLLDDPRARVNINQWRPGGTAWFTVLHQAAWHCAPTEVAAELVKRGAVRPLRDAKGRTALDIRLARDNAERSAIGAHRPDSFALREGYLRPPRSPLGSERIQALDTQLKKVIDGRIRDTVFAGRDDPCR